MMRFLRDQRGEMALATAGFLVAFLAFASGLAGYVALARERDRLERGLNAALAAAASQADPLAVAGGPPDIDAARACGAFVRDFPRAARLGPARAGGCPGAEWAPGGGAGSLAGPLRLERFEVYRAADAGRPTPAGRAAPGASVFAQVAVPAEYRIMGRRVAAVEVRAAGLQAAPVWDQAGGGWR